MNILGIDPGLNCTGVAWSLGGEIGATSVRWPREALADRIWALSEKLLACTPPVFWDLVVIEKPQVYQGRLQKGDPNDLIDLSVLVGSYLAHLQTNSTAYKGSALLPTPSQWKGQVPKDIHHKRIRAAVPDLGRLSKDAMDAVGLVLYGKERHDARP